MTLTLAVRILFVCSVVYTFTLCVTSHNPQRTSVNTLMRFQMRTLRVSFATPYHMKRNQPVSTTKYI